MSLPSQPETAGSQKPPPSQTNSKSVDAAKPFDSSAKADVILRTSDAIDFHVIKLLLSSVSAVFDSIFAKSEDSETRNNLPVIAIPEDSKLLRRLLLLVYAHIDESPGFDDINLCSLSMMTQEYAVGGMIKSKLNKMITIPQLGTIDPFRVYVTAIHLKWHDLAATAAEKTWETPLKDLANNVELCSISGADFHRYLVYRFRRTLSSPAAEKHVSSVPGHVNVGLDSPVSVKVDVGDVASPFDSSAKADIILRSSDFIDFFVMRSFLCFVSPHFSDVLPQVQVADKATTKNGLSVFTVAEDSKTLRELLLLICPSIEEARLDSLEAYFKIRMAAQTYKMSIVNHKLEKLMVTSPWMRNQPLRVFAMSIRFGWEEAAKVAAQNTLAIPLQDTAYIKELNDITGEDLFQLMTYRFKCAHAACSIVDTADPTELYERGRISTPKKSFFGSTQDRDMINQYLNSARGALAERPRGFVLLENFERETAALKNIMPSQIPSRLNKLLTCRGVLASEIDKATSKVPLHINVRMTDRL
ncbi:hypothetical protein AX15_000569 [Amanita polypyramis BW_CC]|nr:hypothetical protein AX15_000569 [Amanita polypyramis BW_CC]